MEIKNIMECEGVVVNNGVLVKTGRCYSTCIEVSGDVTEIGERGISNLGGQKLIFSENVTKINACDFYGFNHLVVFAKNPELNLSAIKESSLRYFTAYFDGELKTLFLPNQLSIPRRKRALAAIKYSKKNGFLLDLDKYLEVDKMKPADSFFRAVSAIQFGKDDEVMNARKYLKAGMEYGLKYGEISLEDFKRIESYGILSTNSIIYIKKMCVENGRTDILQFLEGLNGEQVPKKNEKSTVAAADKCDFSACNAENECVILPEMTKISNDFMEEHKKVTRFYADASSLKLFSAYSVYFISGYLSGKAKYTAQDIDLYEAAAKRNKVKVLLHAVYNRDSDIVSVVLAKFEYSLEDILSAITVSNWSNDESVKGMLEEYRDKHFSKDKVEEYEKDRFPKCQVGVSISKSEASVLYQVGKDINGCCISNYKGHDVDTLIIPDYIDGKPVATIGDSAFSHTRIHKVVFPKTLKNIGQSAFNFCYIEEMELNEGLNSIGSYAFWGHRLEKVEIPVSVETLGRQIFDTAKNDFVIYYHSNLQDEYGKFDVFRNGPMSNITEICIETNEITNKR